MLGRWSLVALVINSIIGSSVFGLPGTITAYVGAMSPLACLLAGAGIAAIIACFAEVSSYFTGAGGQYLYVREGYGRFAGIWMGWLFVLVRVTAAGSNADLFSRYLALYLPNADKGVLRIAVIVLLIGGLAAVNVRGVSAGANLSNVFAVSKLLPLTIFIVAGGIFLMMNPAVTPAEKAPTAADWSQAILLLVFAYGGFEAALVPLAEAKDPRRDAPFALFTALAVCILIYTLVQLIVVYALPGAAGHKTPLAAAAEVFMGRAGIALMTAGTLVSIYGYMSSNLLNAPRMFYALGERNDLPSFFAKVHAKFRTPYLSIIAFASLVIGFAVLGNFEWNATLSAITRLLGYAAICGCVFLFRYRKMRPTVPIPLAPVWATLGIAFCVVLAVRIGRNEVLIMLATLIVAILTWLWARRLPTPGDEVRE